MSYFRHGDPLDDFNELDARQAQEEARLPKCNNCGRPIHDEHLYLINDKFVCPRCLDRDFRKDVDDYVE